MREIQDKDPVGPLVIRCQTRIGLNGPLVKDTWQITSSADRYATRGINSIIKTNNINNNSAKVMRIETIISRCNKIIYNIFFYF